MHHHTKSLRAGAAAIALAAASTSASAVHTVSGHIVCDNFYQVYSGTTSVWFEGGGGGFCPLGVSPAPAVHTAVINGPLTPQSLHLSIPDLHHYIYIVAWSDDGVQQGLLLDLNINGERVTSNSPCWEVFATGDNRDVAVQAPTMNEVFAQIGAAESASGGLGSSVGWVRVTTGGCNNGTFPPLNPWGSLAPISPGLSWIWYNSGQQAGPDAPFYPGFDHREYLIFRHPIPRGNPCPGDLNGDGVVNATDMALLLGSWGPC